MIDKVVFIVRNNLYSVSGGDTIQIEETAKALRKYCDIEVDIEFTKCKNINYKAYKILHFFNIIRPADILPHIQRSTNPFFISPIFVDYSEFEKNARSDFFSILTKIIPSSNIEYLKVLARTIKNKEEFPCKEYLILGQYQAIKKILRSASAILPNSLSECKRLYNQFGINATKFIVPNAVNTAIFKNQNSSIKRIRNRVICVARIEGLKNQFNLIRALNDTFFELFIVGDPAPNHFHYYQKCKSIAKSNVKFISKIPQEELVNLYKSASIHVLPSWFETTGLSSLEAAVMGCNIVVTNKGDTFEYFGDLVEYCEPNDIISIKNAVLKAQDNHQKTAQLKLKILNLYTWEEAAKATYNAYLSII